MKTLKRWTAFLACCALALAAAGCAGGSDSSLAQSGSEPRGTSGVPQGAGGGEGSYVETDITPPEAEGEALYSFVDENGALVCFTDDLSKQFTSTDGGDTWQQDDGPNAGGALAGTVQNCALLAGGGLLVAVADGESGSVTGLVRLAPDGTATPYPVAPLDEGIAEFSTTAVNELRVLSNNRLLLDFFSGDLQPLVLGGGEDDEEDPAGDPEDGPADGEVEVQESELEVQEGSLEVQEGEEGGGGFVFGGGDQISFTGMLDLETGEVIAEYPDWFGITGAADADNLYLLGYDGKITAKALEDGAARPERDSRAVTEEFGYGMCMATGPEGHYVLQGKNLQWVNGEGEASTLLDGSVYAFGGMGVMPVALHLLPGGGFAAQLDGDTGSKLYRYHWDENATFDPADTLKVWSLEENPLVRAAITAMRAAHPDVRVDYEVAMSGNSGATAEDAIKNLNTRMLGGDGPDVLILDGCPAESYASRGLLQNLGGVVDTSGLFQNLVAPFVTDKGTFTLPTGASIPVLIGARGDLDKAATLAELAQLVAGGKPRPEAGAGDDVFSALPEELRPVLAPGSLREVYDLLWNACAGSVITPEGLDSGALSEMLGALLAISDKYGIGDGSGVAGASMSMATSGGVVATVEGSPLAYTTQRAVLGAYSAGDIQMLDSMMAPPESELVAFPGIAEGSFTPVGLVGIGAGSQRAEVAAQFVNLMLSDEVQGTRTGAGFPVSAAGMEKQIADIDEITQKNQGVPFEFDYQSLIDLAKTPQMGDETVSAMVWEAAQSLCTAEIDVEGAVTRLEQELGNYLAERQ